MAAQVKADAMQMFICTVAGRTVGKDEVDEAQASADKCHEAEGQVDQ